MVDIVPPGTRGSAKIQHMNLTSSSLMMANLRAMRDGMSEALCCPGKFALLSINGETMMSDAPMERMTNGSLVENAKGSVLIAGLGLGMVVHALVKLERVRHVDILEINPDVVHLVEPTLPPTKCKVTLCDVFAFGEKELAKKKGLRQKWDTIYFDIWPTIDSDDQPQITRLKRMFRPLLNDGGWMGVWGSEMRKKSRFR